jgi:hypothetical protein
VAGQVLERAAAKRAESDDDTFPSLDGAIRAVSSADALPDAVSSAAGGDGFLATFKNSGRTMFMPPLESFLVSMSFKAFGLSEFSARLPGILMMILLILLIHAATLRALGPEVAPLAIVILVTSPLIFLSARFVGGQVSEILGLAAGAVALGALVTGRDLRLCLGVLVAATLWLYLSGGMASVVTLAAVAVAYPLLAWRLDRPVVIGAAVVAGLAGVLALLTFLPDSAFFRQFRFTTATFAGGLIDEHRSFEYVLKEVGFGFFPWSALLPLSVAAAVGVGDRPRPERLVLLLWALAPLVFLMIGVRPFHQTMYVGVPALAILTALYIREVEDDALQSRLLAFFAFGLFLVMMKDLRHSPASLVTFLATDPMFAEPGKGDPSFPSELRLPALGMAAVGLAGLALFAWGSRLISMIARLPHVLARGRMFLWVLLVLVGVTLVDLVVFTALKWHILSGAAGPDAARGAVFLRVFLTGPDILALYGLIGFVVAARYASTLRSWLERLVGEPRLEGAGRFVLSLERPPRAPAVFAVAAVILMATVAFKVVPDLSLHLSQKHIVSTYEASATRVPGDLFRHGVFAGRGQDVNFYTGRMPEMSARSQVIERLKDNSRRTFFIVPKNQWSEIWSAFRTAGGVGGAPVLDDRSSRFILVSSSLAPGETDRNWLAGATLNQASFDAMADVQRLSVNFDDKIEVVGLRLDSPAIRRGGKVQIETFFKVLDKVPQSYRIFLHVDRVGASSRLHGDHWIRNLVKETEDQTSCVGCYATTHWIKGDVVVDSYELPVPIGSPSGTYDIWMGFYVPGGDRRLAVKDFDKEKIRHDGQNRVRLGSITVE